MEIQIVSRLRGKGLGRHLMYMMHTAGRSYNMDKAMLTVFKENTEAITFYCGSGKLKGTNELDGKGANNFVKTNNGLGYQVDEISPSEIFKGSQRLSRYSYEILSKNLK
jgi:ribosomal protein S18 acetylase RimI-like enzyme